MSKTHNNLKSLSFALSGLKIAVKNEPNLRIHLTIALLAVILAVLVKFNSNEWVILLFTIAFVLILELINTTLEALVDLVSPEIRYKAKIAKDVSAAAVLVSAILSLIIGVVLFLPKIFDILLAYFY